MPRYLLHSQHIFEAGLREAGTEWETDEPPSPDMEPLDAEALKRSRAVMEGLGPDAPGFGDQPWHAADWKLPVPEKPPVEEKMTAKKDS